MFVEGSEGCEGVFNSFNVVVSRPFALDSAGKRIQKALLTSDKRKCSVVNYSRISKSATATGTSKKQ